MVRCEICGETSIGKMEDGICCVCKTLRSAPKAITYSNKFKHLIWKIKNFIYELKKRRK